MSSNAVESSTTNPKYAVCPECHGYGKVEQVRNAHSPYCDGEEINCHNSCPVQEQYLDQCPVCEGHQYVPYAELMAYVLSSSKDPLDKAELIEDCIEGAKHVDF